MFFQELIYDGMLFITRDFPASTKLKLGVNLHVKLVQFGRKSHRKPTVVKSRQNKNKL